ncbi:Plus3 domain-containing protein [Abeliophyllum distichum]|uniref:Plus3 domain-containing protein n=1 Tax=Abeliophyllum distichum TaxID=126358 RepID=A0ABD1PRU3_9LAMI
MYRILDDIEFIVPGPNDRADDSPLGCVALNQVVLVAGLRLLFPRIVRKFLREWGIAPTQLCPNGWRIMIGLSILWDQLGFPRSSIRKFNSLYSFKSDGKRSGWWYASVKDTSLKNPPMNLQKELEEPGISVRISGPAVF